MTIKQIYDLAIKMGIDADMRPNRGVYRKLKQEKERYADLRPDEKREYDLERLTNPYADTRVFAADPGKTVKRILAGVDINPSEVLLANELSKKKPIDLIFAHHPIGEALAGMHEVMQMQIELLSMLGVPIHLAEGLMKGRIAEVSRSLSPVNHYRTVDTARLLGFPVMCVHTPCDNLVHRFLRKKMEHRQFEFVKDVLKVLKEIPEYQEAMKRKAGPVLFAGAPENYTGKIALTEMTGGTSGAKEIYEKLSQAGYGTLIGMHMKEESKTEAEKHHLNIIIAGHMASDSLGINLFLDELEKRGIEIIPCSGLIRIKRFKKRK